MTDGDLSGRVSAVPEPRAVPWFRRLARVWGLMLFILLVAFLFRGVLLPFVFALAIAYILAPVVSWLSTRMPRWLAVISCYLALLATLVIFGVAFLPRLSNDFARLGEEAPKMWERAQKEWTPIMARWLEKHFPSLAGPPEPTLPDGKLTELPPPPGTVLTLTPMANGDYAVVVPSSGLEIDRVDDKSLVLRPHEVKPQRRLENIIRDRISRVLEALEGQVSEVVKLGQALVAGTITFLTLTILVLLVAAYILIDLEKLHAFARDIVPPRHRGDYDTIVRGIDRGLHGVIRGQLLVCLIDGILTYAGLLIFSVKYALLLALVAGVFALVPIFGIIFSAVPVVLVATVSGESFDLARGLVMLLWIVGVHAVDAYFMSPRIIGRQARMHPVLIVFALLAGANTGGIIGALLAIPVASIVQTFFMFFRSRMRGEPTAPADPGTSGRITVGSPSV